MYCIVVIFMNPTYANISILLSCGDGVTLNACAHIAKCGTARDANLSDDCYELSRNNYATKQRPA